MSSDSDDRDEYVMGPSPDYDPPPVDELRDPEISKRTNARGADLVREVLADHGIRKLGGKWLRDEAPAGT